MAGVEKWKDVKKEAIGLARSFTLDQQGILLGKARVGVERAASTAVIGSNL